MPEAPYAVLLVAYGAPGSLDDVEPYLHDVRGGRPTPPELVEELKARYAAIGGTSPLLERTCEQATALRSALRDAIPVYVAMRHWHPFIRDVLARAAGEGVRRMVAIAMAPHFSRMSIGAYQARIEQARGPIDVALVPEWHLHPRFLDAVAERVRDGLARFPAVLRDRVPLVFTAHSLPARILDDGDPYPEQLRASVAGVMARLGEREHHLAYQSAGRTGDTWLGPDAAAVIEQLARRGVGAVLVCPIGFVADHLEVLYDVDHDLSARAWGCGIRLERTASLNASPPLIEALADLTRSTACRRGWS